MAMYDRDWYQDACHERRNPVLQEDPERELHERRLQTPGSHWKLLAIGVAALSVVLVCRWPLSNYGDWFNLVPFPALFGPIVPVVSTMPASADPRPINAQRAALFQASGSTDQRATRAVELTIFPSRSGAFFTPGIINGHEVLFAVDNGASTVVIPDRLRQTLGLSRGRYMPMRTATEVVAGYETRIASLSIGPIRLQNVEGELNTKVVDDLVLLGMTALKQLEISHSNNRLILRQDVASRDVLQAAPPAFYSSAPRFKRHLANCMGPDRGVDAKVIACMEQE